MPPEKIQDLLERRADLSTFLVHFTKGGPAQAEASLMSILSSTTIEARKPWGVARKLQSLVQGADQTQQVVCFTDTPLEHSWMMVRDIAGRSWDFQPYGIVLSKGYARGAGCHPIWYLNDPDGPGLRLSQSVEKLVEAVDPTNAEQAAGLTVADREFLNLTPFMEYRTEAQDFHWEREWRHRGDFAFTPRNVVAVYVPSDRHIELGGKIAAMSEQWAERRVPLLDPRWGANHIVFSLSNR